MPNEKEAMDKMWELSVSNRNEYASKIIDLNKTVISISGVMLSIFGTYYTLGNTKPQIGIFEIQLALVAFLLCILLGIVSLHGHAEIHQKIIEEAAKKLKGRTPSQALEQLMFSSVSQGRIYYWSSNLCPIVFFGGINFINVAYSHRYKNLTR